MRYTAAVQTDDPHNLQGLQRGQWITYGSARGRWIGRRGGCVWIAWSESARKRFPDMVDAFHDRDRSDERAARKIRKAA